MHMKTPLDEKAQKEAALVKSYMDLTGSSESKARGVFMYVCADHEPTPGQNGNGAPEDSEEDRPSSRGPVPAA
jgi:hypothetical protein